MYAGLDSRTMQLAEGTLKEFYAAGGTLAVEYESTGNINSWGIAAPYYYDWNTPKLQATQLVEQSASSQHTVYVWGKLVPQTSCG